MNESSARMLTELQSAAKQLLDWKGVNLASVPNIHIAIMSEPFLSYVLEGKKTVESRFSLNRIAPYGKAHTDDIVFMKSGPIVGYFIVSWVKMFDLSEYPISEIAREYGTAICADEAFWKRKSDKRYVTLMGIKDVQALTPAKITKLDQRAWVSL